MTSLIITSVPVMVFQTPFFWGTRGRSASLKGKKAFREETAGTVSDRDVPDGTGIR